MCLCDIVPMLSGEDGFARRHCTLWVSNLPEILTTPTVLGVASPQKMWLATTQISNYIRRFTWFLK
jgi:hypothetical protein